MTWNLLSGASASERGARSRTSRRALAHETQLWIRGSSDEFFSFRFATAAIVSCSAVLSHFENVEAENSHHGIGPKSTLVGWEALWSCLRASVNRALPRVKKALLIVGLRMILYRSYKHVKAFYL